MSIELNKQYFDLAESRVSGIVKDETPVAPKIGDADLFTGLKIAI